MSKRLEFQVGRRGCQGIFSTGSIHKIFDHAALQFLERRNPTRLYAFNKGCSQTCSTFNHTEAEVDWNRVEGSWKQLKGKIKEQWGNLTDDDIEKIAGKREQLEGKIQERYGTSKDAVRKDVDEWLKKQ